MLDTLKLCDILKAVTVQLTFLLDVTQCSLLLRLRPFDFCVFISIIYVFYLGISSYSW
jgi:hypothetical protein